MAATFTLATTGHILKLYYKMGIINTFLQFGHRD